MHEAKVCLRELTVDDINDGYLSWFKDELVTEYLEARNLSHHDAVNHLLVGQETGSYIMLAVVDTATTVHIGNVKLGPISTRHATSELSIVIGHRDYWGKGLATEAIRLATRLAFDELGVRKMSAGVIEGNSGSLKAFERAGWFVEARLRGQYLLHGTARDRIVLACFNPQLVEVDEAEPST